MKVSLLFSAFGKCGSITDLTPVFFLTAPCVYSS